MAMPNFKEVGKNNLSIYLEKEKVFVKGICICNCKIIIITQVLLPLVDIQENWSMKKIK